jgi:YesN/AraC family two-component response regulator
MSWLLLIAISIWLFSLATIFLSNLLDNALFNIRTEALLSLILIWSLAHFGLQQKQGLVRHVDWFIPEIDLKNQDKDANKRCNEANVNVRTNKKYQRSALSTEQSARIADKINTVMKIDQLYLDADLSLQKLAHHVAISPNYISQTLNETLSINFFDFVNQWRIEAAKPKILANQDNILNISIEVGFNARSSFYKAFKQETGQTPSGFCKQYIQN